MIDGNQTKSRFALYSMCYSKMLLFLLGGGGERVADYKREKKNGNGGVGVEGGSNTFLYLPMALTVQLSVSGMTSEGRSRSSCTSCFCSSAKTLSRDRDVRDVHDTL